MSVKTPTSDSLPVVYGGFAAHPIPTATARLVTAKSEHYLCNPHIVIKELLRLARIQKTTCILTAVIAGKTIDLEVNPSYLVMVEYLPAGA